MKDQNIKLSKRQSKGKPSMEIVKTMMFKRHNVQPKDKQ